MSGEPDEILAQIRSQTRWARIAYLTSRLGPAALLLTVWIAIEGDRGVVLLWTFVPGVALCALWRVAVARRGSPPAPKL